VSFLGVYTLYRAAFRIIVDIETSTPPISSVILIHLSARPSAILDDSLATRRLLSKKRVVGSQSSSEWSVGNPEVIPFLAVCPPFGSDPPTRPTGLPQADFWCKGSRSGF
jgi:hypothetical protein